MRARLADARREALARLAGLDGSFDDIVDAARDSNLDDEHDPEGITIAAERSMVAALAGSTRAHLSEVEAALARLDAGTYGICAGCGRPIAEARLEARPSAVRCIDCA